MKDCAAKRLAVADQKLNAVYQKLLQKTRSSDANYPAGVTDIPPKYEEKLVESELAWIKLRDANCLLDATRAFGGTAYGLLETECLIKETNARIQFLEEQLRLRSL